MMNKIIGAAVLLLCFCSCVKDNDAIYYPVGNVDIEKGGPALEVGSNSILVAESYNEEDYVLAAKGHVLHVSQEDDTVTFYDTEEDEYVNVWKDYFDMDRDYSAIKKTLLEKDDKLKDAIESMWGVRILNQEFFEILISFIISQNKQIPHIKKIVADVSAKFGTYMGTYGGVDMYTFPTLEQLTNASEEDFKELKTGFRAPYIMDAIRRNMAGQFDEKELRGMDYESCVKELMTIKGVGEKVANCVSLFGLGKKEAFPVDVWIKRIMETMYFDGVDTPKDKIAAFAKEQFGELGGFAQQYLFYYGKTIKMGVK